MKIGEFAKKYDLPISTIRYYINEVLITPQKNGSQFSFNDFNEFELQLIIDLRESSFSLEEMRQFVNLSRIFDEKDPSRYKELYTLFEDKKNRLIQQIETTKSTIHTIDLKLGALKSKESVMTASNSHKDSLNNMHGLPLNFLPYLACPDCGKPIDLSNVQLSSNQITSGVLECSCGYEGLIEDGIIYVDKDIDLDMDPAFCDDYFIDLSISEHEPIFFECFLSAPQHYLSINYKTRLWIHENMLNKVPKADIILCPDIAALFPYLYKDAEYIKNATIIVMGLSRKTVTSIRKHIDTLDANLNIIYIVAASNRLPIKRKSIDLMIDYMSSYNYAFFFKKPMYEYIDPYFSDNASILGSLAYYDLGAKSVNNIVEDYKYALNPFITLSSYKNTLMSYGYNIIDEKEMGFNTVLSDYFHYHEYGEKQYLHAFFASRSDEVR